MSAFDTTDPADYVPDPILVALATAARKASTMIDVADLQLLPPLERDRVYRLAGALMTNGLVTERVRQDIGIVCEQIDGATTPLAHRWWRGNEWDPNVGEVVELAAGRRGPPRMPARAPEGRCDPGSAPRRGARDVAHDGAKVGPSRRSRSSGSRAAIRVGRRRPGVELCGLHDPGIRVLACLKSGDLSLQPKHQRHEIPAVLALPNKSDRDRTRPPQPIQRLIHRTLSLEPEGRSERLRGGTSNLEPRVRPGGDDPVWGSLWGKIGRSAP